MTQAGKYLYCIIRCGEARAFEGAPVGDGLGPVYAVPKGGLAVVVSDAAERKYEGTRVHMLAHECVQERVMREFSLLPVRFGTVTNDFASAIPDIQKLLDKRFREFDALLTDMGGKVELGLKALWRDEKAIFDEIVAGNPDIRRLRDSLAGKPPAVVRFEGVRLGELVKAALGRKKSREAATILAPFRRAAIRVQENDVILDRMILNAAFLVDKGSQGEFDQLVSKLDAELGHRVIFKYVGPAPPYNFVNITVNWEDL
jgi:hypothetical protein